MDATPFEGLWNVAHSTMPDGTFAYTGRMTIRSRAEDLLLEWDISDGRYVGVGLPLGDRLFVACGEQLAGLGVALLTPGEGEVTVRWANAELGGHAGSGAFVSPWPGSFEGEHALELRLPGGQLYGEWTLTIQRTGAVYTLAWRKEQAVHWRGLALETPQGLAAAWYPDPAQLALLDYRADPQRPNRLQAAWALGSYTELGTEALERLP